MSEKIKQLIEQCEIAATEMSSAMCHFDKLEANVARKAMEEAEQAILAEFAKLNAVREKLVEALQDLLGCTEFRGGIKTDAAKKALAANAELEGK